MIAFVLVVALLEMEAMGQGNDSVVTVGTGKTANLTYPGPVAKHEITCSRILNFTGRYALVPNPDGSISITISLVTKDDKGTYICQNNSDVKTSIFFSLIVVDPIAISLDQSLYNLGDKLVVTCSAVFYLDDSLMLTPDQDLNLILVHNGDTLWTDNTTATTVSSTRKRTLSFPGSAQESMRTSNITCVLKSNNFSESGSLRVNISYPPNEVEINKSRSFFYPGEILVCSADSVPTSSATWVNVNKTIACPAVPVPTSRRGMAILNLTESCLGFQTWNCSVTWPVNDTVLSKIFQFTVMGLDSIVVTVGAGMNASLIYPIPVTNDSITCSRNQKSIHFTDRYGLASNPDGSMNITISRVTKDDRGRYLCQTYPGVITSVVYSLIVVDSIDMSLDQTSYNLGDNLVVNCSAVFYLEDNLILTPDQDMKLILMHNGATLWTDSTRDTTVSSTRSRSLSFTGTALESMWTIDIDCVLRNNHFSGSISKRVNFTETDYESSAAMPLPMALVLLLVGIFASNF